MLINELLIKKSSVAVLAFFKQENLVIYSKMTFVGKSACYEIKDSYLLKSSEISWLLTKNLKESYYHIADSFIKNKYDFRIEISFMSK